jgi:hypothetical protein
MIVSLIFDDFRLGISNLPVPLAKRLLIAVGWVAGLLPIDAYVSCRVMPDPSGIVASDFPHGSHGHTCRVLGDVIEE